MCGRCLGRTASSPGLYPQKMGRGCMEEESRASTKARLKTRKGFPSFFPARSARPSRSLSHPLFFFSFPPPPTGYVRIRLKSGAIIGVGDCKCRVGAGSTRFHRKSQMSYFQNKGPITIRTNSTTRRQKLTRELASLRGSRVEFQEMGDRFAILFEFFMNFPRVRDVVR